MMPTSKLIDASPTEEKLAEAYAILRQVRHYLMQPAPLPRAQEDVRKAVREFCEDFEAGLRAKARPMISPPLLAEDAAPVAAPQTGDVPAAMAGAAVFPVRQAPPSLPTMTAQERLDVAGCNSILESHLANDGPEEFVLVNGKGGPCAMRLTEWLRYREMTGRSSTYSFPRP